MILNMSKPNNISSFNFIYKIKKKIGVKKISHAGTLDPLAQGVMLVLTDESCKEQDSFMKKDKEYIAEVLVGAFSESFDLEKPLEFDDFPPKIKQNQVIEVLNSLTGEISLPVPIFSAKSVKGKRLYEYARADKEVELPLMNSKIYKMELLEIKEYDYFGKLYPVLVIRIACSTGTYIRTLAYEIGLRLGYRGVLLKLIRTKVGEFSIENSQTIEDLKPASVRDLV